MEKIMAKEKSSVSHKIFSVIGIVLCIILIPVLTINITLIIKSNTNKDEVPNVGGYLPMIVLTDSMNPNIKSGDLIICRTANAEDVKENDIISFFDPAGSGSSIVTHRVIEIVNEDGRLLFRTKGDNNDTEDINLVPAESLVGIYQTRIAQAGNIAMFMQSSMGLVVCVVLPVIMLIGYDIICRRAYEKKNKTDRDVLLAELESLKAEKAEEKETVTIAAGTDETSDK